MRRIALFTMLLVLVASMAVADIKSFDVEVTEAVGNSQSQDSVEAFALQKAKRLSVEKAGTYLSSLAVVKQGRLTKQEVTALASGIVHAEVLENAPFVERGVVHVRVKARVAVDTSVLDDQVQSMLHDKELLKKLEDEQARSKDLEEQLKNLKGAELARLTELNRQTVALEMEREKQRLFRDEQRLKAQGALAEAGKQQLREERERMERFQKMLKQQEEAKQKETEAITREQDRIRKAQLENERQAMNIARKAELNRVGWVPIDDRLSLQQAINEVNKLTAEISYLRQSVKTQYETAKKNLNDAYDKQMAATRPILPPEPAAKDTFETTDEYNRRMAKYKQLVALATQKNIASLAQLKKERRLKLCQLSVDSLQGEILVLQPFVNRLEELQSKSFLNPAAQCSVALNEPEADLSRFPVTIRCINQQWKTYWTYSDRDHARAVWQTRAHLIAEALYQVEDGKKGAQARLVGAKVSHPGTKDERDFVLSKAPALDAREYLAGLQQKDLPEANQKLENAPYIDGWTDPTTGMEFVWVPGGSFQMGDTFGDGGSYEKPHPVNVPGFWMGKYEVTQDQWERIMGNNRSSFKGGNRPVETVSWDDAQDFIRKLNSRGSAKFRLPTEAEWEYACRSGGQKEKYAGSDHVGKVAWYGKNSGGKTHPVGQLAPNGLGLYDMSGNVWEWCQDWYDSRYYGKSPRDNPQGPGGGSARVVRGGSWFNDAESARCANRNFRVPGNRYGNLGFRLARTK